MASLHMKWLLLLLSLSWGEQHRRWAQHNSVGIQDHPHSKFIQLQENSRGPWSLSSTTGHPWTVKKTQPQNSAELPLNASWRCEIPITDTACTFDPDNFGWTLPVGGFVCTVSAQHAPEWLKGAQRAVSPVIGDSKGGIDVLLLGIKVSSDQNKLFILSPVITQHRLRMAIHSSRTVSVHAQTLIQAHGATERNTLHLNRCNASYGERSWTSVQGSVPESSAPTRVLLTIANNPEKPRPVHLLLAFHSQVWHVSDREHQPRGPFCTAIPELCSWKEDVLPGTGHSETSSVSIQFPGQAAHLHILQRSSGSTCLNSPFLHPSTATQIRMRVRVTGTMKGTMTLHVLTSVRHDPALILWTRQGRASNGGDWETICAEIPRNPTRFRLQLCAYWKPGSQGEVAFANTSIGTACCNTGVREPGDKTAIYRVRRSVDEQDIFPPPSPTLTSDGAWEDHHVPLEDVGGLYFQTCGANGPHGPTQAQCNNSYHNTNISVTVPREGPLRGVQIWRVPATKSYEITAYGAAGGQGGRSSSHRHYGAMIWAVFWLLEGELLHILVGQQGADACPGVNEQTKAVCLGESVVIEEEYKKHGEVSKWSGGG
uniref:Leukocyte receptor tyrosine kinase n=1 Tax=Eptatretus burgeri TaxID=7764 RepID=A0A8C4NH40_EPTBU